MVPCRVRTRANRDIRGGCRSAPRATQQVIRAALWQTRRACCRSSLVWTPNGRQGESMGELAARINAVEPRGTSSRGLPRRFGRRATDRVEVPRLPVSATTRAPRRRRQRTTGGRPHQESPLSAPLPRRDEAAKQPGDRVRIVRRAQAVDMRKETWA
jgi:hypothetical protein